MDDPAKAPDNNEDVNSLEGSDTVIESPPGESGDSLDAPVTPPPADGTTVTNTDQSQSAVDGSQASTSAPTSSSSTPTTYKLHGLARHFNIYLVLFVVLLITGVAVVAVAVLHGRNNKQNITSQQLSQNTLNQLANSDVNIGNANQILNVQSNAVFAGAVLARSNLQVAGKLQAGNGLSVSGNSIFDQLTATKSLSVGGDTILQGALTVQKSLTVAGDGSFQGTVSATQITAGTLQLNGDLTLTHHLIAGGPTPSRSNGDALGSGGSASVSGSDTAGSVAINTGTNPTAGCFITLTFTKTFASTPHVSITPIGSGAAGVNYYVNRTTKNLSICTASAPPATTSFGFDYLVAD